METGKSSEDPLDEAFKWLTLTLTIIAGALFQFPEIYPLDLLPLLEPIPGWPEQYLLLRMLISPVVLLTFFWLWSLLTTRAELKIMLKSLSWILASIILMVDIFLLLWGVFRSFFYPWDYPLPEAPFPQGGYTLSETLIGYVLMGSAFLTLFLPVPFYFFVIRPKMRQIYKDSRFARARAKQVLLFLVGVLLYVLAMGLIDLILVGSGIVTVPAWK